MQTEHQDRQATRTTASSADTQFARIAFAAWLLITVTAAIWGATTPDVINLKGDPGKLTELSSAITNAAALNRAGLIQLKRLTNDRSLGPALTQLLESAKELAGLPSHAPPAERILLRELVAVDRDYALEVAEATYGGAATRPATFTDRLETATLCGLIAGLIAAFVWGAAASWRKTVFD